MPNTASTRPDLIDLRAPIGTEEHPRIVPPPPLEPGFRRPPRRGITSHPWIRFVFAAGFRAMQRAGFNLTPNHFYWPIPDFRQLDHRNWQALPPMVGVDLRLDDQLQRLESFLTKYRDKMHFPESASDDPTEFHVNNGFFETVDRSCLQHGSSLQAASHDRNRRRQQHAPLRRGSVAQCAGRLSRQALHHRTVSGRSATRRIPRLTRLIERPAQQIPLEFFDRLGDGDILFLDSSHVVSVGSDVLYEYLEILPRLHPGVVVHVHDVFLPADYPRQFVMHNLCFWAEQYLLQAFLAFNPAFEVLWSSSAVHIAHRSALQRLIPYWRDSYLRMPHDLQTFTPTYDGYNVWPCSFWMRRTHQSSQTVRS